MLLGFVVGVALPLTPIVIGAGAAFAAEDDGPPERIMFDPGSDHGSVTDSVNVGATDRYVFGAAAGQIASVAITDDTHTAVFTILSPDGSRLSPPGVQAWSGTLPTAGDFGIEVAAAMSVDIHFEFANHSNAPTSPTPQAVANATIPSICGLPGGQLVDGDLPIPPAADGL